MKKYFISMVPAALLIITMLLVCQLTVLADSAVSVDGNAKVVIENYTLSSSAGAKASIEPEGDSKVVMQAELAVPGDWACFAFTVKNNGAKDARLADVIQSDNADDNILISYGISQADVGEYLKSGQQCRISVVVQLDPEMTENIAASGDFGLTLVYEADPLGNDTDLSGDNADIPEAGAAGVSPKTGDDVHPLIVLASILWMATFIFWAAGRNHYGWKRERANEQKS